jgi:hypothetical protein
MMQIDVLANFGFDLSELDVVRAIAAGLPNVNDRELVLDLSGCVLDYPATSVLVDEVIERLQANVAPRRLELRFNIPFPARVFEKWFFFGSKFLPKEYPSLTSEELRAHLTTALRDRQTTISISKFNSRAGAVSELALYG